MTVKIDSNEFRLMRDYIEKHCGIFIDEQKTYLMETRLTTLMVENGCRNFTEFYSKALGDKTNALRDKIVDAMTTNETLWFRDRTPFTVLEEVLLPQMGQEIASGKRSSIKIWSSACSTGQEPYSIAMIIREYARKQRSLQPHHVTIVATDISPSVLFLAKAGRYDGLVISRGLPDTMRNAYFKEDGKVWVINDEIKNMVTFKKMNLQEDFAFLGRMDIIFCRNVLIYFAENFKKDILQRVAKLLRPRGYLIVGASESITNYSTEYDMRTHSRALYYQVK